MISFNGDLVFGTFSIYINGSLVAVTVVSTVANATMFTENFTPIAVTAGDWITIFVEPTGQGGSLDAAAATIEFIPA